MSDRTSAGIFGDIFVYLAKQPETKLREVLAKHLWNMTWSYDFSHSQLGCDDELLKLGLAKMGIDPEFPEEGDVVAYKEKFKK